MTPEELGEWMKEELNEEFFFEKTGWAPERVLRVSNQLQKDRIPENRKKVIVYFGDRGWTFTGPGRYIFFCRRLLERCPTDAACAFIIAHELAHHDLGHFARIPEWARGFAVARGAWVVALLARGMERRFYGPETEAEADKHALDLCYRAGYDPRDALDAFAAMRSLLTDLGAQEVIYGPDFQLEAKGEDHRDFLRRIRYWGWQKALGYYPLDERERLARDYVKRMALPAQRLKSPTRPPEEPPRPHGIDWVKPPGRDPVAVPGDETLIELESGSWRCKRVFHAIAFFNPSDDEVRMLGRANSPIDTSLQILASEAADQVFRRWWWGPEFSLWRIDRDRDRTAVVTRTPRGSLDERELTQAVLLGPGFGGEDGVIWSGLGRATEQQLNDYVSLCVRTRDSAA